MTVEAGFEPSDKTDMETVRIGGVEPDASGTEYETIMEAQVTGSAPSGSTQLWDGACSYFEVTILDTVAAGSVIAVGWSTTASADLSAALQAAVDAVGTPNGTDLANIKYISAEKPMSYVIRLPSQATIKTIAAQTNGAGALNYILRTIQ